MNYLASRRRKRLGGMSAKSIALPLAIVIALLQIALVVLIVFAILFADPVWAWLTGLHAW